MLHVSRDRIVARHAVSRVLLLTMGLCLAVGLVGCASPPEQQPSATPFLPEAVETEGEVPGYLELVQRYNANIEKLDRLRASSVIAMRWRDEDGTAHYEQGEGRFMFIEPNRVALTLGKLGDVMLWAGANDERYWMFDLRDSGVAYVGEHENVGKACTDPLPLAINPRAVPHLLGLLPLDESLADAAPPVEVLRGHYMIEPPGLNLRMLLHPETALPVRVDLVNSRGESAVIAMLDDFDYVEQEGVAPDAGPRVSTRAVFHAMSGDAELTLHLAELTDGRRFDTINEDAFDYDVIAAQYEPAETVQLDEACNGEGQADTAEAVEANAAGSVK